MRPVTVKKKSHNNYYFLTLQKEWDKIILIFNFYITSYFMIEQTAMEEKTKIEERKTLNA